jgi:hypothetical protein
VCRCQRERVSHGDERDGCNEESHHRRRRDLAERLLEFRKLDPIFRDAPVDDIFDIIAHRARQQSIASSSCATYNVGVRRFYSFLDLIKVVLAIPVVQSTLNALLKRYVVYLFSFAKLAHGTIITYLAGLQHHFYLSDAGVSVWSPLIHQILKGFVRIESDERPLSLRHKLPFTRSMVESSRQLILNRLPRFEGLAIYAALCMGLMFLFRKSEFLTDDKRKPKVTNGVVVTLLASKII